MDKKGNMLAIVVVILALTVLAFVLIGFARRECNSNRDCPSNAYCNTNYECQEYPNQIVVKENNFFNSAMFLGVCLVLAAYIFKTGKIPLFDWVREKFRKKE